MKKVPGWKKIEIVCVIIVVAFMSFLIGIYYQSRTERGSIRSLCSGWYQMKDGKRIELELPCSVTADAEGKVILYNDTLTEDDRGLIVSTRGIQDNLEIRTGERILYHYADNQFQKNKQMKGKMWADVRLPEETGQEPLCFIYEGTAGRSLDIQVPILGSYSAIIVRHLQASAFSILMIISMLGLGIVAVSLVSFYAFMLMSVPMLHFIQNTVSKENQWIPEIWILLFYGNAIGQGIVNIWFAVPFKNMLFVTHLILFTGVAAMAILLWREYQKHQTQELELCLKAFGVLGISGVIALALYWMYAIYWYDALFQFGILLFISFLFWGLLCKVSNDIQYRMEQAVYERMSIEDRMTGMKNRKAFEQQLDQLQQDAMLLENALLIFIDIANLKTINDTYGMQIGDEAVIRTARSIQAAESDACEQHTECFRIAGDEFAIVVTRPQKRPEEWEQMIRNEMKKESGSRYPVQLEFGCSYLRKADGTLLSISDWKMQADRMMFSYK